MASESENTDNERPVKSPKPRSQLNTVDDDNLYDATDDEREGRSEEGSPLRNILNRRSFRREEEGARNDSPQSHGRQDEDTVSILQGSHHQATGTSNAPAPSQTSATPLTYQPSSQSFLKRKNPRKRQRSVINKFTPINKKPSPESPESCESLESPESPPAKKLRPNSPAPKRKARDFGVTARHSKRAKTASVPHDFDDTDGDSSSSDSTSDIENRPPRHGPDGNDLREDRSDGDDENMSDSFNESEEEVEGDESEDLPSEGEHPQKEKEEVQKEKDAQENQSEDDQKMETNQDGHEDQGARDNNSEKEDEGDKQNADDQQDEESQDDEGQSKQEEREDSRNDTTEEEDEEDNQTEAKENLDEAEDPSRKTSRKGSWKYGTVGETNQDLFEKIARVARESTVASGRVTRSHTRGASAQPEPSAPVQPAAPIRAPSARPSTAPTRDISTRDTSITRGKSTGRGGRNVRQQSQKPRPQTKRGTDRSLTARVPRGIHSKITSVITREEAPAPQQTTGQGQDGRRPTEDAAATTADTRNTALPSVEDQQVDADEVSHYEDAPESPAQQAGDSGVAASQSHDGDSDNRTLATTAVNALTQTSNTDGSTSGRRQGHFILQPRDQRRTPQGGPATLAPIPQLGPRRPNPIEHHATLASYERMINSQEQLSFFDNPTQPQPAATQRREDPNSAAPELGKKQQKKQPQAAIEPAKTVDKKKEKQRAAKTKKSTMSAKPAKAAKTAEVEAVTEREKTVAKVGPEVVSQEDKSKSYTIFVCGDNRLGQLALGDHVMEQQIPVINECLTAYELKDFDCGASHCIALTRGGTVLTWGLGTKDNGALGSVSWQLDAMRKIPQPVNLSRYRETGDDIVQVVATNDASFALTREGKVLGWGCFKHPDPTPGQQRRVQKGYPQPMQIRSLRKIVMLAAGGQHLLALSGDGELFAMGWNNRGQHGMDPDRHHGSDSFDDGFPIEALEKGQFAGVKPAKIACGENTSYLIDQEGKLYSWGDNSQSQLGADFKGGYTHVIGHRPVLNAANHVMKVVDVAGGVEHSLACDKDGNLLAWGRLEASAFTLPHGGYDSRTGQMVSGNAPRSERSSPTKVPACNAIRSVAAGAHHSIVLDSRGEAYTYGVSTRYQTGQGPGNTMTIPQPEKLQEGDIRKYKVTRASAGATFTIFAAREIPR